MDKHIDILNNPISEVEKVELKIQEGTKVYLRTVGTLARYKGEILSGYITKVGIRYFYVGTIQFDIKTLKCTTYKKTNHTLLVFASKEEAKEAEV